MLSTTRCRAARALLALLDLLVLAALLHLLIQEVQAFRESPLGLWSRSLPEDRSARLVPVAQQRLRDLPGLGGPQVLGTAMGPALC